MGLTIVWDGNTLALTRPPTAFVVDLDTDRQDADTADGHRVSHLRRSIWIVDFAYAGPLTLQEEADLWTWWSWAAAGGEFSVARSGTEVASTTLDATAASGQKVVPVTATTGFATGQMVVVTKEDRSYYEVGVIDTVLAGVSVTLTANLKQDFAEDDVLRHYYYLPLVTSYNAKCPIRIDGAGSTNHTSMAVSVNEVLP